MLNRRLGQNTLTSCRQGNCAFQLTLVQVLDGCLYLAQRSQLLCRLTPLDNGYTGSIKTLTLNIKAKFVVSEKDNDKAPDYRIFAGATEFGAAWKKTARDSVREYLSVKLDDPSFPAPIYASLVRVEGDEGFSLIWSRRSGD